MNSNALHNYLNIIFLMIGVLVTFDWTVFGFAPEATVKIVGGLMLMQNLLKIVINVGRDGVTGMFAPQPPVEK